MKGKERKASIKVKSGNGYDELMPQTTADQVRVSPELGRRLGIPPVGDGDPFKDRYEPSAEDALRAVFEPIRTFGIPLSPRTAQLFEPILNGAAPIVDNALASIFGGAIAEPFIFEESDTFTPARLGWHKLILIPSGGRAVGDNGGMSGVAVIARVRLANFQPIPVTVADTMVVFGTHAFAVAGLDGGGGTRGGNGAQGADDPARPVTGGRGGAGGRGGIAGPELPAFGPGINEDNHGEVSQYIVPARNHIAGSDGSVGGQGQNSAFTNSGGPGGNGGTGTHSGSRGNNGSVSAAGPDGVRAGSGGGGGGGGGAGTRGGAGGRGGTGGRGGFWWPNYRSVGGTGGFGANAEGWMTTFTGDKEYGGAIGGGRTEAPQPGVVIVIPA